MKQLLIKENIGNVPQTTGVYRVFFKNKDKSSLIINRFCGNDIDGILYIGRTKKQNLRKRIYQFFASSNCQMGTHNHSGGLKCKTLSVIRRTYPECEYWFDFEESTQPIEKEKELLLEYSNKFGEYPPLNK